MNGTSKPPRGGPRRPAPARRRPARAVAVAVAVVLGLLGLLGVMGDPGRPAAAAADVGRIAAANGRSETAMARVLADPSARVGIRDRVYFEEDIPPAPGSAREPASAAAPFPAAETFLLHSRPGSSHVLHLDFDGQSVSGSAWNSSATYGTGPVFEASPFDRDGTPSFSADEHATVQTVWQRVAEDFAVFDVDVTTQDPGPAGITRSGIADQAFGLRVVITNTSIIYNQCSCGGIAYLSTFNETTDFFKPAFVFSAGAGATPKFLAEAASHEAGHGFGLAHDGLSGTSGSSAYYGGHGSWGPIMGVARFRPVGQWSAGEYAGANNREDDLAVIAASGAPLLPDDHADTTATSATLGDARVSGLISTDSDVDVFRVTAPPGPFAVWAGPARVSPNLDIELELRDDTGALVAAADPPVALLDDERAAGLAASLTATLTAGRTYFLSVTGVGTGDPTLGYSGYASVGPYTLSTKAPPDLTVSVAASSPTIRAGHSGTVTATTSHDVGPTPYVIQIIEDSVVRQSCETGTTCTYAQTYETPGSHAFSARVATSDGTDVLATTGMATVNVVLTFATIQASSPQVAIGTALLVNGGSSFDVGPTPYVIQVFEDGALRRTCGTGTTCAYSLTHLVPGEHTYSALVSAPDGSDVQATSPTISVKVVDTGSTFAPLSPARLWDSRSGPGPVGPLGPGATRSVPVTGAGGVPVDGVSAVVLNVTAVSPTAATYVTAWPSGEARPLASNLNVPAGDTRPNLVTVKVGAGGQVSFSNDAGTTHLVVDVAGWYGPAGGQRFNAVSPSRIWDSRSAPGPSGRIEAGGTRAVAVTGVGGVPATGVTAVVLNVTTVSPSAATYVTAWPAGEARPLASNLNVPAGDTRPNLVTVKVGAGGQVSFYNNAGTTDLIADVAGWYGASGSSLNILSPSRLWDSRTGPGPVGRLGAGDGRSVNVAGVGDLPPNGLSAVVLNVTAVNASAPTFVTTWPAGEARPLASNLNVPAGDTRPNLVIVKVDPGGQVSFSNAAGEVDLIADVAGWFGPPLA